MNPTNPSDMARGSYTAPDTDALDLAGAVVATIMTLGPLVATALFG